MKHLVSAARQEQIKFLNKFPVYKKVQEANAKARNVSRSVVVASTRSTATTWACGTRISVETSIHARRVWCHSTIGKSKVCLSIKSRLVNDDIGGNWSSNCSCHKASRVHFHPPIVHCTSLCRRKDAKPSKGGQVLRRIYGRKTWL